MFFNVLFCIKYYTYAIGIVLLTYFIQFLALYSDFTSQGPIKNEYDYIIVGAGTGGTTILSGMSGDFSVLLIDAGGIPSSLMDIPILTPLVHGTHFDWGYKTTSQNSSCKALNEEKSKWSMGKGFGGSNILNNMISHWGHQEDFRGWFGYRESYDYYKDILPHFKENDDFQKVAHIKNYTKFGELILKIGKYRGITFSSPKLFQKNGRRWTMAHEALRTLKHKHEIVAGGLVTKVLFNDGKSGKLHAIGVQMIRKGRVMDITAKYGVILSAGTIGTPKILLHSGIGPCKDISSLGIKCKLDLPVGHNLQDHVATGLDLITLNKSLGLSPLDLVSVKNVNDYVRYGYGSFAFGGCEALGFLEENDGKSPPKLGFMIMPVGITADLGIALRYILNLHDKWWEEYFQHIVKEGHQTVSILPILLHPRSRGVVKLQNSDPLKLPYINPRYFEDRRDVALLVKGLQLVDDLMNSPEFRQFGAKIYERPFPGCEHFPFKSESYWECYARHLTLTVYHPVGTCRMGDELDSKTVVTRDYRVKGTENLFVVDASILPHLPSGNPNAVIAMLARRFVTGRRLSSVKKSEHEGHYRDEL